MVENTLNKIIKKKEQKLNELKKITSIELLKEKYSEFFEKCIFVQDVRFSVFEAPQ